MNKKEQAIHEITHAMQRVIHELERHCGPLIASGALHMLERPLKSLRESMNEEEAPDA